MTHSNKFSDKDNELFSSKYLLRCVNLLGSQLLVLTRVVYVAELLSVLLPPTHTKWLGTISQSFPPESLSGHFDCVACECKLSLTLLKIFLKILSDLRTAFSIFSIIFSPSDFCQKSFTSLEPVPPFKLDVIVSLSLDL